MRKIGMIVLASALSLGTSAVLAQDNSTGTAKNPGNPSNVGSSGTARSPANVNSNAATNAGSPQQIKGAKPGNTAKVPAASANNPSNPATGSVNKSSNTGPSGTAKSPTNINSNAAANVGSPQQIKGAKVKPMASLKGRQAYAKASQSEAAQARASVRDRRAVIVNNRLIGRDPDSFIRFQLRRDDPARNG